MNKFINIKHSSEFLIVVLHRLTFLIIPHIQNIQYTRLKDELNFWKEKGVKSMVMTAQQQRERFVEYLKKKRKSNEEPYSHATII